MPDQPEVTTASNPDVGLCTVVGVDHDWRSHTYWRWHRLHTSWRCVWCHAVACGDYDEPDPCMEPYHHAGDHVSQAGVRWPIGGDRP